MVQISQCPECCLPQHHKVAFVVSISEKVLIVWTHILFYCGCPSEIKKYVGRITTVIQQSLTDSRKCTLYDRKMSLKVRSNPNLNPVRLSITQQTLQGEDADHQYFRVYIYNYSCDQTEFCLLRNRWMVQGIFTTNFKLTVAFHFLNRSENTTCTRILTLLS